MYNFEDEMWDEMTTGQGMTRKWSFCIYSSFSVHCVINMYDINVIVKFHVVLFPVLL